MLPSFATRRAQSLCGRHVGNSIQRQLTLQSRPAIVSSQGLCRPHPCPTTVSESSFPYWKLLVPTFQIRYKYAGTHQRSFSTTTNTTTGEEIYQQALQALQQVEQLQEEYEEKKSQELHRAIEKAEAKEKEHKDNPKAKNLKGVTVVKTVVKQTRKDKKQSSLVKEEEAKWHQKAHELLQEAALKHGHPKALILLGNGALQKANALWKEQNDKESAKQSVEQAMEYYESAGTNGSAEGWFNLGQLLWTGYPAKEDEENTTTSQAESDTVLLKPDLEASMTAFWKSIDLGDPDAMYFVGVQLLSKEDSASDINVEVKASLIEGLGLIETSANLGHGPASYYLALLRLNGNDNLEISPCTPEAFVAYLDAACDTENAEALLLRGHSRHEGENGYAVNYSLALKDFIAAAESGNSDGAVSAGAMLHQGRQPAKSDVDDGGVAKDQSKAFELYQMAGEMGNLEGWRNVVACYALGEGVPRSEATARYIAKTMLHDDREGG